MKLMIFAAAAMALAGCAGVPVTRTAANDDACLRKTVSASVGSVPVAPSERLATKCKSNSATWSGITSQKNRSNEPGYPSGG